MKMSHENFCFWLQGFFDLNEIERKPKTQTVSNIQADLIRRQLLLTTDLDEEESTSSTTY